MEIIFLFIIFTFLLQEWRENVLGSIDTIIMMAQNLYERISMSKITDGLWNLLDPVVMGTFLEPNIIQEIRYANNSVNLCGKLSLFNLI